MEKRVVCWVPTAVATYNASMGGVDLLDGSRAIITYLSVLKSGITV